MGAEPGPTDEQLREVAREAARGVHLDQLRLAHQYLVGETVRGELTARQYYRGLTKLAWSYRQAHAPQLALELLSYLTPVYLSEEFAEDAVADAELLAAGEDLVSWMVAQGYVDQHAGEAVCLPMMQAARA